MNRTYRTPGLSGGFSLIEVMIAVVVLATGLLALAALQASLTRSSAESKTRSRVAAMLSARMDELRNVGYDNAILNPTAAGGVTTTSTVDGCGDENPVDATDWVDCTRIQANLERLDVTQINELYTSNVGAASFATVNARPADSANPQFIRVALKASWKTADADSGTHSMTMTSELSSLALRDALLPPPPASSTPTGRPIVRTDNPAGAGVIPIAVGGGDATAASNPRPEAVGKKGNDDVLGTRFDVLTYSGLVGTSVIQRRVETSVVRCQCQLGEGTNLPAIFKTPQWPAIWTGERYDLYKPTNQNEPAPGVSMNSGPAPNVTQSDLCTECCRDHFDKSDSHAKFDPERVGAHDHFNISQGVLVAATGSGARYVESCRLIRVDGFWRTAADAYSRQFGLLQTTTVGGKEAGSGLPQQDPTVTNYQAFVKDYLKQVKGSSGSPPTNAQALFDEPARGLNDPEDVDIAKANVAYDDRYLHVRGLYLDYLEPKARDKIKAVLADNAANGACPSGTDVAECILPYLPFTTVNTTELATWKSTDTKTILVNSGNLLEGEPLQPSGGRTQGINKGIADNQTKINMSNFGLAASTDDIYVGVTGVDTGDAAAVGTDSQRFDVGGDNADQASVFTVKFVGFTTQDPDVKHLVGSSTPLECKGPERLDPKTCVAGEASPTNFSGGTVIVRNYWITPKPEKKAKTYTCSDGTTGTSSKYEVPTFVNYRITGAKIGNVDAAPGVVTDNGVKAEATTLTFGPELVPNAVIELAVAFESGPMDSNYTCTNINNKSGNVSGLFWTPQW